MDTTNCSAGFASDRIMLYGDDFVEGSCNVPMSIYLGVFASMAAVRVLITMIQFKLWSERERRVAARIGKTRKRFPLVPMLSLVTCASLLLFVILTSLNIANSSNGAPLFLLNLFYFPVSLGAILSFWRVVKVGKKIIPLAKLKLEGSENDKHFNHLSEATWPLKALFVFHAIVIALTPVAATVGLAIPVYPTYQAAVVGFAAQDLIVAIGIGYQYQRVINAIKACQYGYGVQNKPTTEIDKVITQLRILQMVFAVVLPLVAMVYISNIFRWLLPYYWVVFIQFGVEVSVMAVLTASHARAYFRARHSTGDVISDSATNKAAVSPRDHTSLPSMTRSTAVAIKE